MRGRNGLLRGGAIAAVLVAAWLPAPAGRTDSDGKPPTSGSTHGSGWNPRFTCTVGPADTLDDLLECLADGLSHQGPGLCPPETAEPGTTTIGDGPNRPSEIQADDPDGECFDPMAPPGFWVTRWLPSPPHYGLEIRKSDASEIDRLLLWEDDPSIQMTHIEIERPGLGGRIGAFAERPDASGGVVTVTVNGRPVSLDTAVLRKPADLTWGLAAGLRSAGFLAAIADLYVVVLTDPPEEGITSLRFQSGNPAIVSSDLAILPLEELPITLEARPLQ